MSTATIDTLDLIKATIEELRLAAQFIDPERVLHFDETDQADFAQMLDTRADQLCDRYGLPVAEVEITAEMRELLRYYRKMNPSGKGRLVDLAGAMAGYWELERAIRRERDDELCNTFWGLSEAGQKMALEMLGALAGKGKGANETTTGSL